MDLVDSGHGSILKTTTTLECDELLRAQQHWLALYQKHKKRLALSQEHKQIGCHILKS